MTDLTQSDRNRLVAAGDKLRLILDLFYLRDLTAELSRGSTMRTLDIVNETVVAIKEWDRAVRDV